MCIAYSILPLRVLLNLKQVLVLHVGKNVSVVVGGSATLSLADMIDIYCSFLFLLYRSFIYKLSSLLSY